MKQNLQIAKTHLAIKTLILVTLISIELACVRMPVRESPLPQTAATESASINLNTASAEELEKLPGIGKVIADRIVEHRAQYGLFRRPEHLMMVQGVSDEKFRAIRSRVRVD